VELDHVLIGVTDLDAAARDVEARYGLASVEGGRHPAWGTANRIVPLGTSFLELVAVIDEAAAAGSSFGRWVASGASRDGRPIGWVVRTGGGELDAIADRLDLSPKSGSRVTPSGDTLRWRVAGIDEAAAEPALPFFIEWGTGVRQPGTADGRHPAGPAAITRLLLDGDPDRVAGWLGEHTLPIVVRPGRPGVAGVVISTAAGEVVIGAETAP
jgi:hypothetical protein